MPAVPNRVAVVPDVPLAAVDAQGPPPPAYHSLMAVNLPGNNPANRPNLPVMKRNRFLSQSPTETDPDALVVKFQTIVREEKEIVVGRLKVQTNQPTPNEHAFILRRYDTGAISVTTMYKAAFPSATADEEEREMKWIKSSFDMTGMNGSRTCDAVKLAGNWIPPTLATHLAPAYKLALWIDAMARAQPEQGVAYRKSQRSQLAAETIEAKRKAQESASEQGDLPAPPPAAPAAAPAGPPRAARPARQSGTTPPAAPAAKRTRRGDSSAPANAPGSSAANAMEIDETESNAEAPAAAGGETVSVTLQATTSVRAPTGTVIDADAQIAESKATVLRLKAEALARSAAGESAEDLGLVEPASNASGSRGLKRTAEEAEAGDEVKGVVVRTGLGERAIAGRVPVPVEQAGRRQYAWGGVLLGAGAGLAYLASNFL